MDTIVQLDYQLPKGSQKSEWHSINKEADGVIAWDYSNHAISQYVAELINADGSSSFSAVVQDIQRSSMTTQFKELSLFWDISCTTDCSDNKVDYRVMSLNHDDNSSSLLLHETCDLSTEAPSSNNCTVNP